MELELKYRTDGEFSSTLIDSGFTFVREEHLIDSYYLIGEEMGGKTVYLRIREDAVNGEYEFEFDEIISDVATKETAIPLISRENMVKMKYIMAGLGMPPKCTINKYRKVFEREGFLAVVDKVKDLGFFVEIELEGENDDGNISKLRDLAEELGLESENLIAGVGYPDLWLGENGG